MANSFSVGIASTFDERLRIIANWIEIYESSITIFGLRPLVPLKVVGLFTSLLTRWPRLRWDRSQPWKFTNNAEKKICFKFFSFLRRKSSCLVFLGLKGECTTRVQRSFPDFGTSTLGSNPWYFKVPLNWSLTLLWSSRGKYSGSIGSICLEPMRLLLDK